MTTSSQKQAPRRRSPGALSLTAVAGHADGLAVPSAIARAVLELVERDDVSARHIADRARRSPEIASLILRAASAESEPTLSLEDAAATVGNQTIAMLLTSRPTYRLSVDRAPLYESSRLTLLHTAIAVAEASALVARRLNVPGLEAGAYSAGLLADMAKPVLAGAAADSGIDNVVHDRESERELMGADHARVGGWVLRRWNLPDELAGAVEAHHAPAPPDAPLARAVWLGNLIVDARGGDDIALDAARIGVEACELGVSALEDLLAGGFDLQAPTRPPGLTDREVQVLRMMAAGQAAKQVAHELGCSLSTVHNHLHHVYRKLGVSGQAQALLLSRENGWV